MWSLCLYTTARVPSLISKSFRSHRGITTCPFTVNDTVSVLDVGVITIKLYSIPKSKSNEFLLETGWYCKPFRSEVFPYHSRRSSASVFVLLRRDLPSLDYGTAGELAWQAIARCQKGVQAALSD